MAKGLINNDSNKLLAQAEQMIESNLTPEVRPAYLNVVVAGLKVGLNNNGAGFIAAIDKSQDPVAACGTGAANLVLMLRKEAKGNIPDQAIVPASCALAVQALGFAERAGLIQTVGPAELGRAIKAAVDRVFVAIHLTMPKLVLLQREIQGIMQDPQKVDQMRQRAGTAKHPQASVETTLPEGDTHGV